MVLFYILAGRDKGPPGPISPKTIRFICVLLLGLRDPACCSNRYEQRSFRCHSRPPIPLRQPTEDSRRPKKDSLKRKEALPARHRSTKCWLLITIEYSQADRRCSHIDTKLFNFDKGPSMTDKGPSQPKHGPSKHMALSGQHRVISRRRRALPGQDIALSCHAKHLHADEVPLGPKDDSLRQAGNHKVLAANQQKISHADKGRSQAITRSY